MIGALSIDQKIMKLVHLPSADMSWMRQVQSIFESKENPDTNCCYHVQETRNNGLRVTSYFDFDERGHYDFNTKVVQYGELDLVDKVLAQSSKRDLEFYLMKVEDDMVRYEKVLKALDYDVSAIDDWCKHMLFVVSPFSKEYEQARITLLLQKTNATVSEKHRDIARRYGKTNILRI